MTWILTRKCECDCAYCYLKEEGQSRIGSPAHRGDAPLSKERLLALFEEARALGVQFMTLVGGEPFLHPHIVELCQRLKELGSTISVNTKSVIPQNVIDILDADDEVFVSLDSSDKKQVTALTGSVRAYDDMLETLRRFGCATARPCVFSVLTSANYGNVMELIAFAETQKVRRIELKRCIRSAYRPYTHLLLTNEQWQGVVGLVLEKYPGLSAGTMDISIESTHCDPASQAEPLTYEQAGVKPCSRSTCPPLSRSMVIDYDGTVCGCHRLPELALGNVREKSLLEVWQSEALRLLAFPTRDMYADTRCASCEFFDECIEKNRCMYYSHLAYGRYFAPAPYACCKKTEYLRSDYVPFYSPEEH